MNIVPRKYLTIHRYIDSIRKVLRSRYRKTHIECRIGMIVMENVHR